MDLTYTEIVDFIRKTARGAGEIIRQERELGPVEVIGYKRGTELVTTADVEADKYIIGEIRKKHPDHVIISEELYPDWRKDFDSTRPMWIIDPIDGTVNYAHNHYQVAVSIAFACDGKVQAGVVHNPFLNETFYAAREMGAWLNGKMIECNYSHELQNSIIATGFPYDKTNIEPLINRARAILSNCQDLRRLGSGALDICWVACGRLDGFYETLSLWDFAAAALIAEEANAKVGNFGEYDKTLPPGFRGTNLLIAAPAIYDKLFKLLDEV